MYILLGISFLLHILSIFAIIILFQRRTLERIKLPTLKEDVESLHESMEAFIDEIEKENEGLYERLVQYITQKEDHYDQELQNLKHNLDLLLAERSQGLQESTLKTHESSGDLVVLEELASKDSTTDEHSFAEGDSKPPEPFKSHTYTSHTPPSENTFEALAEETASKFNNTDLSTNKMEQVKTLYRQGFSVEHIAKVLQMGKGETELVIHLMGKK